jgi:fatty acid desaturase
MRAVHLLKRGGRKFVRSLFWMLVAFGPLAAILIFFANLPILLALPYLVIFVSVLATITTALELWSGAQDEALLSANRGMSPERGHSSGGTYYPGFLDGGAGGDGGGGGGL